MPDRSQVAIGSAQMVAQTERVRRALRDVEDELWKACAKFPPLNSAHEGKAVIEEELDELWQHVKANTGYGAEARVEAIQVAAMALRYVVDVSV